MTQFIDMYFYPFLRTSLNSIRVKDEDLPQVCKESPRRHPKQPFVDMLECSGWGPIFRHHQTTSGIWFQVSFSPWNLRLGKLSNSSCSFRLKKATRNELVINIKGDLGLFLKSYLNNGRIESGFFQSTANSLLTQVGMKSWVSILGEIDLLDSKFTIFLLY